MMLSNITVPLLGLVDTAVLGHLAHPGYLAAVAIGSNIFTFVFWAFGFLRMGTTGLVAQSFGSQDQERLLRTSLQAIGLGLIIGAGIIANQFWLIPLAITLMDGSEQVQALASSYCHVRIWGAPATLIQYALIGTFIGLQQPKISMQILIFINVLNIIFDIVFVVVLDLNVVGVALATIIAEYSGVLFSIYSLHRFFYRPTQPTSLPTPTVMFTRLWKKSEIIRFFTVNFDIFVRTCCLLFVFAFFTSQGAKQGDIILAANAVLLTFLLLISNTLDGFANAAEALVGELTGRPRSQKTKIQIAALVRAALWWCIAGTTLLTIIFGGLGAQLIMLLTDITEVKNTAIQYLGWLILMPSLACLSYLYDGVFVGAIRTRAMRNIMITSLLLVFLPCWLLTQNYGNHGLWFALSIFMIARSFLMHLSYRRFIQE